MFELSQRSLDRMKGVHPDLVKVIKRAIQITPLDFGITQGLRTIAEQKKLLAEGKSQTMNSRHLTGHAVDIVVYVKNKVNWDFENYEKVAAAIFKASKELNVPIVWGGHWVTFKDGPHFELDRSVYR